MLISEWDSQPSKPHQIKCLNATSATLLIATVSLWLRFLGEFATKFIPHCHPFVIMANCYLEHLPVELLEQICAQFCPHCRTGPDFTRLQFSPDAEPTLEGDTELFNDQSRRDRSALARLCRTSKTLQSIGTRYLYHWIPTFGKNLTSNLPPERTLALLNFSRTVRANPELAKHIKYLDLPLHFAFTRGAHGYRLRQWPRSHHKYDERLSVLAARLRAEPLNQDTLRHLHEFILQNASTIQTINVNHLDNPVPERNMKEERRRTYPLNSLTTLQFAFPDFRRRVQCPSYTAFELLADICNSAPNLGTLYAEYRAYLQGLKPSVFSNVKALHLYKSQWTSDRRGMGSWDTLVHIARCGPLDSFSMDVAYGVAEDWGISYFCTDANRMGVNEVLSHLRLHQHLHQQQHQQRYHYKKTPLSPLPVKSLRIRFLRDRDPLDDFSASNTFFSDDSFASKNNNSETLREDNVYDKRVSQTSESATFFPIYNPEKYKC